MNKRNQYKISTYKSGITHCCNPDCGSSIGLHVHHIVPLGHDGIDNFVNYIVLCRRCHQNLKLHSNYESNKQLLLTWKFMAEILDIGVTSDDTGSREFSAAIRASIKARNL